MRNFLSAIAAALVIGLASHGFSRAALDATPHSASSMELLVFEHPDCTYCQAFRSRIAPRYQGSPQAAEAPLRYFDIAKSETHRLSLKSPITMVPTAVLMKDGREFDRIAGYWGTEDFLKMVAFLIGRAE